MKYGVAKSGHRTSSKREIKRPEKAALSIAMVSLAVCGAPQIIGTSNYVCPNLPVVAINIPVSFVCS